MNTVYVDSDVRIETDLAFAPADRRVVITLNRDAAEALAQVLYDAAWPWPRPDPYKPADAGWDQMQKVLFDVVRP